MPVASRRVWRLSSTVMLPRFLALCCIVIPLLCVGVGCGADPAPQKGSDSPPAKPAAIGKSVSDERLLALATQYVGHDNEALAFLKRHGLSLPVGVLDKFDEKEFEGIPDIDPVHYVEFVLRDDSSFDGPKYHIMVAIKPDGRLESVQTRVWNPNAVPGPD
jgi:hypothetical protein